MQEHDDIVSEGRWVSLRYRLYDSTAQALEDHDRDETYLHGGFGHLFPKIEEILEGRRVGEHVSVYLEPEDAFGDYDAALLHIAERGRFPEALEVGMDFEGIPGGEADDRIYTVTDIVGDTVVVDGNHPLAGIAVRFDLEITGVRPATDEELETERARWGH
ncbi:MAG: peptidylprolyl isomerase [Burkholderiaceae bacterium]